MRILKYLLPALLSLLPAVVTAQDFDSFYRGVNTSRYQFRYNGTPYWSNEGFKEGTIFYDGKTYSGIDLNIDCYSHKLIIKRKGDALSTDLLTDKLAWATIGDDLYLNLRYNGIGNAPEGLVLLLKSTGDMLFGQVTKTVLNHAESANGRTIGYYDPRYNDRLLTCFAYNFDLWLVKDGTAHKITNKKAFLECYPQRYKELKAAGRRLHRKDLQQWCSELLDYMNLPQADPMALIFDDSFRFRHDDDEESNYVDNLPKSALAVESLVPRSIPDEWFSDGSRRQGTISYVSGTTITAIYQNKVYEVGDKARKAAGPVKISGRVVNSATDEPIPGAIIHDKITDTYAQSDRRGRYTLELPTGENVLYLSEPTMEDFSVMVDVFDNASMDIVMNERAIELESAMISAESRANHRTTKMGLDKLSIRTIKRIPTAFGEADVLKVVQSLPGVKSVGEASGGINVRGGSSDQNLILYNESTIYYPSHMFGLFSTFNPDIVSSVDLYKSSIPVEYGGRISSVLDVGGKEGNYQKYTGSLGIGVLTSHAVFEGPIKKDTSSFVVGARTTYSDWILGAIPTNSSYSNGTAAFSDINLGYTRKFGNGGKLRADGYWSRDRFGFTADTTFRYSCLDASVRYEGPVFKESTLKAGAGFDSYSNDLYDFGAACYEYNLRTDIRQAWLRGGIQTPLGEKHVLSYGAEAVQYFMNPGEMTPRSDSSLVVARRLDGESALQPSVWVGDSWAATQRLSLEYGLRLSAFASTSDKAFYCYPEARIAAKYTIGTDLSFKAGFNNMTQYIHLISNTSSISPMDTWKLCDSDIAPQRGWQAAGGAYYTAFGGKVDFSLEGYLKRMNNYLDYKSGATLVMNPDLADDLVTTTGKAYGVEFMAKKTTGKLNGWIAYTWSRTMLREMENRGKATINGGDWYNAPFDKPHDLKVVGNYSFTHRYSLSFNLDYSTGRPVTMPVGKYWYGNLYRLAYSDRNACRIPDYFRLDLAMNVEPGHNLRKLTHFSVTFGVYNVTGRHNAYSVYYTTNGEVTNGYMLSVFAVPIPYLTINMRF